MESRWSPCHNHQNRPKYAIFIETPPGLHLDSISPCGVHGVHMESMGEGKVHYSTPTVVILIVSLVWLPLLLYLPLFHFPLLLFVYSSGLILAEVLSYSFR